MTAAAFLLIHTAEPAPQATTQETWVNTPNEFSAFEAAWKEAHPGQMSRYECNSYITRREPYRLEALLELLDNGHLDDPEIYWLVVSDTWQMCTNIHEDFRDWERLWNARVPGRIKFAMSVEDRAKFDDLGPEIEIFRGCPTQFVTGLSWTTDIEIARWFARRWAGDKTGWVARAKIRRRYALVYLNDRAESEIVTRPCSWVLERGVYRARNFHPSRIAA